MEDGGWRKGRFAILHSPFSILALVFLPFSIVAFVFCRFQLHSRSQFAFIKSEPTNSQPGMLPPALVKKP